MHRRSYHSFRLRAPGFSAIRQSLLSPSGTWLFSQRPSLCDAHFFSSFGKYPPPLPQTSFFLRYVVWLTVLFFAVRLRSLPSFLPSFEPSNHLTLVSNLHTFVTCRLPPQSVPGRSTAFDHKHTFESAGGFELRVADTLPHQLLHPPFHRDPLWTSNTYIHSSTSSTQ